MREDGPTNREVDPVLHSRSPRRRFLVQRLLGRGGEGTVYLAQEVDEQGVKGRRVALKVAHFESGRQSLARELSILQRLEHPSLPRASKMIAIEGHPTLVMDVEGGEDGQELSRWSRFTVRAAIQITLRLAWALKAVHHTKDADNRELGLLHRDVKPGNVVLTGQGNLVLLDFGIAQCLGDPAQPRVGTPGFFPPERGQGTEVSAGDIFCLGMTLLWMLAGPAWRPPTTSTHMAANAMRYRTEALQAAGVSVAQDPLGAGALALAERMTEREWQHRPDAHGVSTGCKRIVEPVPGPDLSTWAERRISDAHQRASRRIEALEDRDELDWTRRSEPLVEDLPPAWPARPRDTPQQPTPSPVTSEPEVTTEPRAFTGGFQRNVRRGVLVASGAMVPVVAVFLLSRLWPGGDDVSSDSDGPVVVSSVAPEPVPTKVPPPSGKGEVARPLPRSALSGGGALGQPRGAIDPSIAAVAPSPQVRPPTQNSAPGDSEEEERSDQILEASVGSGANNQCYDLKLNTYSVADLAIVNPADRDEQLDQWGIQVCGERGTTVLLQKKEAYFTCVKSIVLMVDEGGVSFRHDSGSTRVAARDELVATGASVKINDAWWNAGAPEEGCR